MKIKTKPNTLDVTVVIPAMNEAPNLYRLLPLLSEALDEVGVTWEILVVDKGSKDGTKTTVTNAGATYLHAPTPGYGAAILLGLAESSGDCP